MLLGPVVPTGRLVCPVRRVAILSDTHGHLDPRVEGLVTACDLVVHGGDIGNAAVLARLQPRLGRVLAVLGNNDVPRKWPEPDRALLRQLPECIEVDLPGGRLVVIHGHQGSARDRHARLRARFPGSRVVVYGHSHRLALDLDALPWVLNPGAAGRTRTYGGPSCLVLTTGEGDWRVAAHRFAFLASTQLSPDPSMGTLLHCQAGQ
ncbi:MAG: metallophosphatase family protein [Thiocapsa sp.]|nr:metallophosphoesterase family protein [Thiocapsa sp.]MCG6897192.1 metallophosphatase family protein [Thiocapsa sp.]